MQFETRSLPALSRSYPRHFTFYVAHPVRYIPRTGWARLGDLQRFETRSLPGFDSCAPAHFDLSVCPSMLLASPRLHSCCYPRRFTLITRTAPVLVPATLAALPSTRAIPDRDVFYVAHPIRSIQRRWCRESMKCGKWRSDPSRFQQKWWSRIVGTSSFRIHNSAFCWCCFRGSRVFEPETSSGKCKK